MGGRGIISKAAQRVSGWLIVGAALCAWSQGNAEETLTEREVHNAALLQDGVRQLKAGMKLPHKVDEASTITDIRADVKHMAIVYYTEVEGLEIGHDSEFTGPYKDYVKTMCGQPSTQTVFDKGMHFQWIHHFKEGDKTIATTLTKEDCQP